MAMTMTMTMTHPYMLEIMQRCNKIMSCSIPNPFPFTSDLHQRTELQILGARHPHAEHAHVVCQQTRVLVHESWRRGGQTLGKQAFLAGSAPQSLMDLA
jgi:hypothetical protein